MPEHEPPTSTALSAALQQGSADGAVEVDRGYSDLQHAPSVRAFLLERLGNLDQAEEAAQETFARAWISRASRLNTDRVVSWLLGIAANVAAQFARDSFRRDRHLAVRAVLHANPSGAESPGTSDTELVRRVELLPDPYRQVILLRYWSGMTCREIAAASGTPVGSVTKQLSRGHAMLRASMNTPPASTQIPASTATSSPGRASERVHTNQGAIDGMQQDA